MSIPDPWLTATDAARYTCSHPDTIRTACRRKELSGYKRGRTWLIRQSALDEWIKEGADV